MADIELAGEQNLQTSIKVAFGNASGGLLDQVTPMEILMNESILHPRLQTSVRVHSYYQNLPIKNLDQYKGSSISIELWRPILEKFNITSTLNIDQVVWRVDSRKLYNDNVEEFVIHACDPTLLIDAETLVSKFWKCTPPSPIVSEVLTACAGARSIDVEDSCCPRDYSARNIHPFRVIADQAEVALAGGNDPSFLHYMTYDNGGTHHFRSLYSLTKESSIITYYFSQIGLKGGYANPKAIMTHNFPCDFDLLSDILNGLGPDGTNLSSMVSINPFTGASGILGTEAIGCGSGVAMLKAAMTNATSTTEQDACPDYSQFFALKRQARMGLLEPDKIALRLVVPWNPELNAGKVITLDLRNKEDPSQQNYGSGDYLIHSLTHKIQYGGFSTTALDCVSTSVGQGVV